MLSPKWLSGGVVHLGRSAREPKALLTCLCIGIRGNKLQRTSVRAPEMPGAKQSARGEDWKMN
jgi:hypothetical protein